MILPDREAYSEVRNIVMGDPEKKYRGLKPRVGVEEALGKVASADRQYKLKPPLTPELSQVVQDAAKCIGMHTFEVEGAKVILQAIFEHGYRSDAQ